MVQSEYQSLEGTSCDDYGNDQNQGFFIENRTSAIAMHQSLFPNFGIQYDEFTSSDSDLHSHYTLEFSSGIGTAALSRLSFSRS